MINWKRMLLNTLLRLVARRRFTNDYSVEKLRKLILKVNRPLKIPDGLNYSKEVLVDLDCEWFVPDSSESNANTTLLLYFPGGGFILPAINGHREMLVRLCKQNGCAALLAQYRIAPEHKMPTGQIDGLNIYRHLVEDLGYRAENVFLMGDSAGGGIALSALLQIRTAQLPLPAGAMLFSPGTDLTLSGPSIVENLRKDPMFHISALLWMARQSLPVEIATNDPLVSPAHGNFDGLPPLLFEVGSTEMLRDHSTLVAERASKQGVEVEITVSPHSPHVYPLIEFLPEAKAANLRIQSFIQRNKKAAENITEMRQHALK